MQSLGLEVGHDNIGVFQDPAASDELRQEVVNYLRAAPGAMAAQQPPFKCAFCDELMPQNHQWDGKWVWPESLSHEVEVHNFAVPRDLVDRIRRLGTPPDLPPAGPDTNIPWPKPS